MTIKENITTVNQFLDENRKPTRFGYPVKGIIIHSCVGSYSGSIAWFKNPKASASAHYVIKDDGEVTLCVPEYGAAWHTGIDFGKYTKEKVVKFVRDNWDTNLNWITIGIELEDKKREDWPYPKLQYYAAVELVADLCRRYKVLPTREFLLMHREVNPLQRRDPIGKWDHVKFVTDVSLAVKKGGEKNKFYNKETTVSVLADSLRVRTGPGIKYKEVKSEAKVFGDKVRISRFTEGDLVTHRLNGEDVSTNIWLGIKDTDLFLWSGGTDTIPNLETVKSKNNTMTKEEYNEKRAELEAYIIEKQAELDALEEPVEEVPVEVPVEEPAVEVAVEETPAVEVPAEETVVAETVEPEPDLKSEVSKLEVWLNELKAKLGM